MILCSHLGSKIAGRDRTYCFLDHVSESLLALTTNPQVERGLHSHNARLSICSDSSPCLHHPTSSSYLHRNCYPIRILSKCLQTSHSPKPKVDRRSMQFARGSKHPNAPIPHQIPSALRLRMRTSLCQTAMSGVLPKQSRLGKERSAPRSLFSNAELQVNPAGTAAFARAGR
ncbi:hypothetical protein GQ607_016632 [Colletotrichum asianum]|uniref:Uncharacterized protein n=1 Tax=Colletotrichum asianum TaxID=702518 RepID=A0A8H3VXT8_9PEZI|nr:hypothetical protein GQ607_016632 [Colletotrichum asianum]